MKLSALAARVGIACLTATAMYVGGCRNSSGDESTAQARDLPRAPRSTPAREKNSEESPPVAVQPGATQETAPATGSKKTEAAPDGISVSSPRPPGKNPVATAPNQPGKAMPPNPAKAGPAAGMPRMSARTVVPGLGAILKLTDDQKKQINEARKAVMNDPELAKVRQTMQDKNATAEQRKAAQAVALRLSQDLNQKTAGIMTPDQKKLLQAIESAFKQSAAAGQAKYRPKLQAAGQDRQKLTALQKEMIQEVMKEFGKKLEKILTPEQKEAMKKAALQMRQALIERAKRQGKSRQPMPTAPGEPAPPGAPVQSSSEPPGSP